MFSKIGVPLFIMISGLLHLNPEKKIDQKYFYLNRLRKIIVPILFWAMIYFLWRYYYHGEKINMRIILSEIITGKVYYHFWFLYMILGLYIFTPYLKVLIKNISFKQTAFLLVLWFSYRLINPVIHSFTGEYFGIPFPFMFDYVGYYIAGSFLHQYNIRVKTKIIFITFCLSLISSIILTYLLIDYKNYTELPRTINSYLSPFIILTTLSFFIIFKRQKHSFILGNKNLKSIIILISNLSFGIYLTHVIFLEVGKRLLFKLELNNYPINPFILFLFTLSASILLSMGIKKIPYLKNVIP